MKTIYKSFLLLLFGSILIMSCNDKQENNNESKELTESSDSEIFITNEQFEAAEMKLGTSFKHIFEHQISVSGLITVTPSGKAKISTPIAGIIKSNPYSGGQYVKKGQMLYTLESNEIILLQQEYAENKALLIAAESEYNRQKKLYEDGITSEKDFLNTKSQYNSINARCSGLKARLRVININPTKVEAGTIVSRIGIYAPINGYITQQNGIIGQYAEPQTSLMEIVNINRLYLKLFPFEKDIQQLKIGQILNFYIPGKEMVSYNAELITVGKSVNTETKTIECSAKLNPKDIKNFVNDTYVEINITTKSKESNALPNSAIIKSGEDYYILSLANKTEEGYTFKKIKLDIGIKTKNFTEILTNINNNEVLFKGAYNIIE